MLHYWMSKSWTKGTQRYHLSSVSTSRQRYRHPRPRPQQRKVSPNILDHIDFVFCLSILDVIRFKRWLQACNNENVAKKPPMLVYKQYRICRRHFDGTSMNGGCRRLLKTAIPKLHLNLERTCDDDEQDEDAIDLPMETDALADPLIGELDDDVVNVQETAAFDSFEIKYEPLSTVAAVAKPSQRRDIRESKMKIRELLNQLMIRFCSFLPQCVSKRCPFRNRSIWISMGIQSRINIRI